VFHGLGYLSQYFVNYFKALAPQENYIIAAQAPSKYYQDKSFKHVGACWLTKKASCFEIENIYNYIDAILEYESIKKHKNIILFGYSQGVSIALRYLAKRQLSCKKVIIQSGGIPKELEAKDFNFLNTTVALVYGTKDEYLNDERMAYERSRASALFGNHLEIIPFEGKHVVNINYINEAAID
jgi:predicted esterase